MERLVTLNLGGFWISVPTITLQDFRITYKSTRMGTMFGTDGFSSHSISQGDGTIRIANNPYTFLTEPPQPEGERDGHYYFQKISYERVGDQLSLYLGDDLTPVSTQPCTTDDFILNALHRSNSGVDADGISWDISIEDLSDPISDNNRFYALDEDYDAMEAIDSVSGQHGTYSIERSPDRVDTIYASEYGFRSRKIGYLKDVNTYEKSQANVIASFSASVLRLVLFNERRQDFEFEMFLRGAEVEFHQYGDGGEVLETIIEDTPANIADLVSMGYTKENVTALIHAGGNDVSNSVTYGANKDTSDAIINMGSRLVRLYDLFNAESFNVVWLPLTWRNYGTVPPESGGSLPYNENIVLPFIKDTVGASSWDFETDSVKYDFYKLFKDGYEADSSFLTDAVHPGASAQTIARHQLAEWLAPTYLASEQSNLSITIAGLGSGSHYMKLWDYDNEVLIYKGDVDFSNDIASLTLGVSSGTSVTGDCPLDNPPTTGTGTWGVTE